jgi:hypothetical protein
MRTTRTYSCVYLGMIPMSWRFGFGLRMTRMLFSLMSSTSYLFLSPDEIVK